MNTVDIEKILKDHNFEYSNLSMNKESQDYGACTFILNNQNIIFRIAKTTPTKIGQFVTLWKRNSAGLTVPYDVTDAFDNIMIYVEDNNHCGLFIFHKHILVQQGILSQNGKGGKRAIRVYPEWCKTENKQATKTQAWQLLFFNKLS